MLMIRPNGGAQHRVSGNTDHRRHSPHKGAHIHPKELANIQLYQHGQQSAIVKMCFSNKD